MNNFYQSIGGDAKAVIERLGGEDTVRRFVKKICADTTFDELKQAVRNSETQAAFRAAHTLKGICVNLEFGNLYAASDKITEMLRAGELQRAKDFFPEVERCYDDLTQKIKTLK